jgi:hypothetical protein
MSRPPELLLTAGSERAPYRVILGLRLHGHGLRRQDTTSTFTYDSRTRLKTATGPWGSLSWPYDAIGNRTLQTKNSVDTSYTYTTANRLDHTTIG